MRETAKNLRDSKKQFPEIIVKFREDGDLAEHEGRLRATHLTLVGFYNILSSVKTAKVRLSFPRKRDHLREMQAQAQRKIKRSIPNLNLFVRIQVEKQEDLESLLKMLNADPEIEYACIAGIPGPPPQTPDFTAQQDYMDSPPDGVDAEYAWLFPGGDGTGVQICDCEYGFNQTHEDLPNIAVISNLGGNLAQYEDHGTAVLGILVGVHDQKGINGIAHGVTMNFASESNGHRLDCINDAIAALNVGDILILEMQTTGSLGGYVPAEYDSDIHAALLTATGNGMVVIAAAGNGSQNLNIYTNDQGLKIWDKNSPDWNDSGSIIVGAGHSNANAIPHSKCGFSTYGDRVNCHGWGEDVVTTGYGYLYDGGHNEMYTDVFGGTSSATPIVAGVAACLQGAAIQALGIPLSPSQIRAILSDVNNGTPQADSVQYPVAAYNIGPMPNLRATLHAAGIQADVFMRDNVADTGVTPYPGNILCWSPDLIARQNMVAQPDIEFGIAHWSEADLGHRPQRRRAAA